MTQLQKHVIQCGLALVILMGVYPPWIYVDDHNVTHSMGYSPFWKAPSQHTSSETVPILTATNLDFSILFLQLILLCATTGIACYMLRRVIDKGIYARK